MEIRNEIIVVDQASNVLKQISKNAMKLSNTFRTLTQNIRNFNNLKSSNNWSNQISQQNRLLNQQIAIVSRIYRMSRLVGFSGGKISSPHIAPINLTSAISAKIKPIDLNGRIRIRGLSGSGSPLSGPSGSGSGGGSLLGGLSSGGGILRAAGVAGASILAVKMVANAVIGLGKAVAKGFWELSEQADKQIKNQYKLSLLTPNVDETYKDIYKAARRSRIPMQEMMDNTIKMAMAAPQAFKTPGSKLVNMNKAMNVSETFAKMAKLSGSSTEETSSALLQFKQALGSNRLAGDELRSIRENMPMMMNYIVEYLNKTKQYGEVSTGSIKQLGAQGKLTADVLVGAMEFAKTRIDKQFKELPMSVSEAFGIIKGDFQFAMTDVSTKFGEIFNVGLFENFFKIFNGGFATLKSKFLEAMDVLSSANGGDFFKWLENTVNSCSETVGRWAVKFAEWGKILVDNWGPVGYWLDWVRGMFEVLGSACVAVVDIFMSFIEGLGQSIDTSSTLSDTFDQLSIAIEGLAEPFCVVMEAVGEVIGWFLNLIGMGPSVEGWGTKVSNVFNKIAGAIQWAIDKVKSLINWLGTLVDKIKSIKLPDWMGGGNLGDAVGNAFNFVKKGVGKVLDLTGITKVVKNLTISTNTAKKNATKEQNKKKNRVSIFGGGNNHPLLGGGGGKTPKSGKHGSPTKNKVQKVEVVNPVKLEEKYKSLLYSDAMAKWASWYGRFDKPNQVEQPINITINGNINSDKESADNLLNKIRGGIEQAARQKLWGPQRTF